ncbi:AMP-binding protein [Microbacterium sp. X-17]|uniref:class I adenylate-forming enzyme family protein n=1 Tax=Microbacterium sp. X-17 TaxID=3144404 RepID=UPI0031F50092
MSAEDSRPRTTLEYPAAGVDAILAGAARAWPDRVALREGDRELTYGMLHERSLRVAAGLRARGVTDGDVVAIRMPNSVEFVVAYFGILAAGATVTAVSPAQPEDALARMLAEVGASLLLTDGAAGSLLDELAAHDPLPQGRGRPDGVAHLQFTGGTTGHPKAVRVLHRNVVGNIVQVVDRRAAVRVRADGAGGLALVPAGPPTPHHLRPGEGVTVAVAPFFHVLGIVNLDISLLLGATVVLGGRFDPARLLAEVERFGVTHLNGTPAMYHALLRSPALRAHDLSSVRQLTSGGAALAPAVLDGLREAFTGAWIAEGYGLSEATSAVTSVPIGADRRHAAGTVGIPLADTLVEIRSPETGIPEPPGGTGELWARGPQIADGYHREPELTADHFRDGWLRTGDLAHVDDRGYVHLVGRLKEMLIYKGYNVYPRPLEELLSAHPAVAEAVVLGAPDPSVGEIPVAFVVLAPGFRSSRALTDDILGSVARSVVSYQKVRELHVVDVLPLSPAGKVDRRALRDRLREGVR